MRCKKKVVACFALLLCTSLVLAGTKPKPIRTTSADRPIQQLAEHEELANTVQKVKAQDVPQVTNSAAQALAAAERMDWRKGLKGARATGDDCGDPIAVTLGSGDLPYVTNDSTCGRYDDYNATCLGYYDGGEDIIYELTLTEDLCMQIDVDGVDTWVGVGIDDACPLGDPCIAYATDSGGDPSMEVNLTAGTYYLMIDTWPSPDCTDFTLTISACPPPCQVTCPGGATPEGEPDCGPNYDDTFNGGCNSTTPVFSPISCDETICGKSGTFLYDGSSYRDTDWYLLNLTAPKEITWTCKAEFPVLIFIIDAGSGNCSDYTILGSATGDECEEIMLSQTVGAGDYWLWVGPSVFTGVPCDGIGSNYVATLTCGDPPPCQIDYSVTAPGNWSGDTCGAGDDCDLTYSEDHMYEVTIPNAGMWVFSLCGSAYDTKLYIGTLCCDDDIGYNDDACGLQSEITAYVTAGTYYVDVEGYSSNCGAYVLDISEVFGPDNDNCQDATDAGTLADGVPVVINGDNTGATEDCAYLSGGDYGDAWIVFTIAGASMDVSVAYCGTSPPFTNGYVVMDQYCPCSGAFIFADDWNNTDCGDGNYTLEWDELPAGLYYWPILTDAGSEGPYTITITGNTCEVCDIECDPAATPEGEPLCGDNYVDNYNGGCNSVPAVFGAITCGEIVCGESGTYSYYGSSYRDTDWYEFTLYQDATVTLDVIAEFDVLVFLIDAGSGNCSDYALIASVTADDCEPASLTFGCDAGTYWAWVGPSVFAGVPCGAEYELTLTTDPADACTAIGACCLLDGTCEVMSEADCDGLGGGYQGDDTACEEPPPPPPPECVDPDVVITVEILTDPYPSETTWDLVEVGYGIVATGGPYYSSYTTYITDVDVCSTSCYTFTIYDAWGDGIYSPGGYSVTYDGDVVASTIGSGWYGDQEVVENIGGGCESGEPPVDPCVDPDAIITVEILTDSWPSETTWELLEVGVGVAASGGPYAYSATLYTTNVDVCSTSCYSFTIYDAYGDGIYSPGGYALYWDGGVIASTIGSGWSGDEETVDGIGDCGGCTNPDATITVDIFTDNYGSETTWELIEQGVGTVASGGPYDYYAPQLYTTDVDVCSTSCYTFIIYDAWGDGICCNYGDGYYNIYYEGELVGSGGVFGSEDVVEDIGPGCLPPLGACWIGHCGVCVETTDFCCDYVGGVFQGYGNSCAAAPPPPCAELDLKPSSCPNSFNRGSHGVLPVALMSSEDVDIADVDISTIRLVRDDLVGGEVAPNEGPPGPSTVLADVGMPFDNEGCQCIEGGPDGIVDISMKFNTDDVVSVLELDSWPAGTMVPLVIKGSLLDGSPFATYVDCLRLVPPGGSPGQMNVTSNAPDCFVDIHPMDSTLDTGGWPVFVRTYENGTTVTLTATQTVPERPFNGWLVNGVLQTRNRTIEVPVDGTVEVKAVYGWAVSQPGPRVAPQGKLSLP